MPARPSRSATRPTPITPWPTPRRTASPASRSCPSRMKVLLENLLRFEDGRTVTKADIQAVAAWLDHQGQGREGDRLPPGPRADAGFHRRAGGGRPRRHARRHEGARRRSAQDQPAGAGRSRHRPFGDRRRVRHARGASSTTSSSNTSATASATSSCDGARRPSTNFRVVPPAPASATRSTSNTSPRPSGPGKDDGDRATTLAYPDTLVGTDSHTTMVNGLAVLGWGVGGIEAEAAMLGQPVSMLIPEVVGFKLTGKLSEGATATDLVLTVTQMLRKKGVVGKFVEFYGPGLTTCRSPTAPPSATWRPEYGATCGFFPVDGETLDYLTPTSRTRRAHRAGRGLCQGAGHVAHPRDAGPGLHRHAGARPRRRAALARRPQAPAGPRAARATPSRASPRRMESEFTKARGARQARTRSTARTTISATATS